MIPILRLSFPSLLSRMSMLLLLLLLLTTANTVHAASRTARQVAVTGIPALYLADDDDDHNKETLYAIDAAVGSTRWSVRITPDGSPQTPFAGFGNVYLNDVNARAFNAQNGAAVWTQNSPPATTTTPVGFNGMVLAGGSNGTFLARNANNGTLVWQSAPIPNFNPSRGVVATEGGVSRVYFGGCCSDNVYALNATTGALLWQTHLGSSAGTVAAPTVDVSRGLVYVASTDQEVYALDAVSGQVVWFFFAGAAVEGSPCVSNGLVYFGSDGGKFYALDASTGSLRWSFTGGKRLIATPAVVSNLVYFSDFDSGTVYALNATTGGSPVWTFHPTFNSVSHIGLLVANGLLYEAVLSLTPPPQPDMVSVYAINATTGAYTWRWDGFPNGRFATTDTAPPPVIVT